MSRQPINVYPARTVMARTRGLIFMTPLPPSSAMHIKPCWCVHTGLLRSPIDIVFLDVDNKVLKIAESVPPWRIAAKKGADSVLEFSQGDVRRLQLMVGDALQLADHHAKP
jgi:uncharacterized membrane protein (UPF0127 family)